MNLSKFLITGWKIKFPNAFAYTDECLGKFIEEFVLENNTSLILILTPERLISYLSQQENPAIGFLFVDEAQKIAQSDTRSITTYVAIEKTLKKYPTVKIYFSSPNISNPEIFLKLFRKQSRILLKQKKTTVAQNLFLLTWEMENFHIITMMDSRKCQ